MQGTCQGSPRWALCAHDRQAAYLLPSHQATRRHGIPSCLILRRLRTEQTPARPPFVFQLFSSVPFYGDPGGNEDVKLNGVAVSSILEENSFTPHAVEPVDQHAEHPRARLESDCYSHGVSSFRGVQENVQGILFSFLVSRALSFSSSSSASCLWSRQRGCSRACGESFRGTLHHSSSSSNNNNNNNNNNNSSKQCKINKFQSSIQHMVTSAATAWLLVAAAAIAWLRCSDPAFARTHTHTHIQTHSQGQDRTGVSERQQAVSQPAHSHWQAMPAAAATATASEGAATAAAGAAAGHWAVKPVSEPEAALALALELAGGGGVEEGLRSVVVEGEEEEVLGGLEGDDVDEESEGVVGEIEEESEGVRKGLSSAYRRWSSSSQPVTCNVPLRVVGVRGAVPSIWKKDFLLTQSNRARMSLDLRPSLGALAAELTTPLTSPLTTPLTTPLTSPLSAPLTTPIPLTPSASASDMHAKGPAADLLTRTQAVGQAEVSEALTSTGWGEMREEGRGARHAGSSSSSSIGRSSNGNGGGSSKSKRASRVGKQTAAKPLSAKTSACSADVVCVSDRWMKELVGRRALAPLDGVEATEWFQRLGPTWRRVLCRSVWGDPDATGRPYAVPFRLGCLMVTWREEKLRAAGLQPIQSWDDLFHPALRRRIAVIDSPRELLAVTARSLGSPFNPRTISRDVPGGKQALEQRWKALQEQILTADSDNYLKALQSGDAWVAIGWSSDVVAYLRRNQNVAAAVPHEGTVLFADLWAIPASDRYSFSGGRGGAAVAGSRLRGPSPLAAQWIKFCLQPGRALSLQQQMFPTASPLFLQQGGTEAVRADTGEGNKGVPPTSQLAWAIKKASGVWKMLSPSTTSASSSVKPLPTSISKDPLDPGLPSEEILEKSDFLDPLGIDALDEMAEILRMSVRPQNNLVSKVLKTWRNDKDQK